MAALVRPVDCGACKGLGTVPRPAVTDPRLKYLESFPALCDGCGGSGKIEAPPPKPEG